MKCEHELKKFLYSINVSFHENGDQVIFRKLYAAGNDQFERYPPCRINIFQHVGNVTSILARILLVNDVL